jgi:hypothetical protein
MKCIQILSLVGRNSTGEYVVSRFSSADWFRIVLYFAIYITHVEY